jgi:hypothetical protein
LPDLAQGRCRGSLELYSAFDATAVQVGERSVPLTTDTTISLAYALNQTLLWRLGMMQFLSFKEQIPTGVYLAQPYEPGKVPVVFVHGTFSSPVWWAEMVNTLSADPVLSKRCQFWYFVYNSGNPTSYSAVKLRESLPFVKRVVFISTPHRGSYLASSFARKMARKLVSLPSQLVSLPSEFAGLKEKLDIPKDLRGTPTSLDSMSPSNPVQQALADIPLAPGVKGHSIIAVKGEGDFHDGKDGLVAYGSAHVDYVESEFIVRGPHSCQGMPPTIEEVRRILREHVSAVPAAGKRPVGDR